MITNFKSFLSESEGLTNRKPGETFVDKVGNSLYFQSVEFYDNMEDVDSNELEAAEAVNKPLGNLKGVAIVRFKNDEDEDILFKKFIKIGTKGWDNKNPGFFTYKSKATKKEESGLKPTDFLKKLEDLTPNDILDEVGDAFGIDSPLYLAVEETIDYGYPKTPIPIGELSETGITNYFAEILQPIAIIQGTYTGNGLEGVEAILGETDLSDCKISFPKDVTSGLYDSVITKDDSQLKISSKFGSSSLSAKASVTNLYKIYEGYGDKSIFDEYETAIEIIKYVAETHQEISPIKIALLLSMISQKEESLIKELKRNPNVILTNNIIKMRDSIKPGITPDPYYHVIAGIAKSVCDNINKSDKIRFSEFASLLLNGVVIQVYTKSSKSGDNIVFRQFDTKWPDDAVTKVLIESGTRYKTNRIDGKMGYKVTER
jgi:hypothetical protein